MRSSNRPYMPPVDHLRAYAALLVVFYHGSQLLTAQMKFGDFGQTERDWLYSANPAATVVYEGHTGVALFMVLSGFIFTVGTLDKQVAFGRFMANRLLRIYPLFLVLLVLGIATAPEEFTFGGFLQTVFGMGNLPGAPHFGFASTMFWAVAVEMQFYLLFPALNALLSRFGMTTFLRLFGAIVVLRALVWVSARPSGDTVNSVLYFNLAGRIDQFLLGMIAAWLFVRYAERFRGWWKVGVALALAVAMLWGFNQAHGYVDGGSWRLLWVDVEGAVWALAILTYVATCRTRGAWSKVVAKVGETSYSTYLLHFMVITTLCSRGVWLEFPGLSPNQNALLTTLLVVLPITLTIAFVTYHGIERPFLRFRVKYLVTPPEPAAPPAGPEPKDQANPTSDKAMALRTE